MPHEALQKARNLCAKYEKSQSAIRAKLFDWNVSGQHIEGIIAQLIQENFINEQRFAIAYATGKFNQKKWGKNKIIVGLKQHKIHSNLIKTALSNINAEAYEKTIKLLIERKMQKVSGANTYIIKNKVAKYLYQKGFEYDIIWDNLNEVLP